MLKAINGTLCQIAYILLICLCFLQMQRRSKLKVYHLKKRLNHPGKTIMKFMVKLAFLIKKKKLTVIDSPILKKNKITMITKNMIIEIFENEKLIVFSDSNNLK